MKMFFFDVDSTLFDHKNDVIRESNFVALEELKNKGYKLALNTSRSFAEMANVPDRILNMVDCLILLDGAYIVKDKKVSYQTMNKDDVVRAIQYLDENDITYRYCTKDGGGYLNKEDDNRELFYRLYKMRPDIKKYEGEEVLHLLSYITGDKAKKLAEICANDETIYLGRATETAPKGCNKGLAMLKVAKEYGYDASECCAFGDSGNDREMIRLAGLGIAMGNYTCGLNEVADYITDDVYSDGVYHALKHFNFI